MSGGRLERILVIEDDPDIRAIIRMALEIDGQYSIVDCGSGKEGVDLALSVKPDLILLDVMMPDMDGPSTLRQLQQMSELAAVPVIFMTARVMPGEIEKYAHLGAAGTIAKPFDPMTLPEKIREIWSRR